MKENYVCAICGESYQTEQLRDACQRNPAEKLIMVLGTVFKNKDDTISILYDSNIERQTHKRNYGLLKTRSDYEIDGRLILVPYGYSNAESINDASPVSEEEFKKVKESLEYHLSQIEEDKPRHLALLERLILIPLN